MKIVLVSGESGVGKSSMVYQATSKIKQQIPKTKRKYITVMKSSCYESDRLVPFSPFRSLLVQSMARFVDEESLDSTSLSTENSNPTQRNKSEEDQVWHFQLLCRRIAVNQRELIP